MTDRKLIVPAIAGILSVGAIASAAEPTASELREQIEALNSKIAKIEAREASATQQQATVASVLNDADRRSQLLQGGGMTAGFDGKKFFIGSADGNFLMSPYFQFQFRHTMNWGEDTSDDGDDKLEKGFEVRRMKFGIKGNAFSKDLTYDFRLAVNRNSGSPSLENAYVQYAFADGWAVKLGQFKDNVYHEETVSGAKQLAADRTLVNELLGGGNTDYVQGVSLVYTSDAIRGELAATDGNNTDNTNYLDQGKNWGISLRGEYKVMGDWKSYDDMTAMGNKEDLLVIGGGVDYTESGDTHVAFHTVDGQWESGSMPLAVYVAYLGVWTDDGTDDSYDWGGIIQAAYMINEQTELFARFDHTNFDGGEDYNEFTVGGNYYFNGQNNKITLDVSVLPDGAPEDDTGLGVKAGTDTQVVFRAQYQLAL